MPPEPSISPSLETTDDGSHTLRHPLLGDTYHSLRGAVGEALHVFIRSGFDYLPKQELRVLEMGFGSGLNAWLTLQEAEAQDKKVEYHTLELYPIAEETARQLNYTDSPLFMALHKAPWGEKTAISDRFTIKKNRISLLDTEFDTIFDVVYFDAFSPDTQGELWSEEVFRRLYEATVEGGVLVTYSSKGEVKRALRGAGWTVERLPGALGKRHMLRAVKQTIKQTHVDRETNERISAGRIGQGLRTQKIDLS